MSLHHHVEGVNVNLIGREPSGIVEPGGFESTREQVIEAARSLTEPGTGHKVFEGVYKREEIYEGDHAHLAPDVVLILDPEQEFGTGSGKKGISPECPRPALVTQSQPTGRALGLEVPREMDGRVLTHAFSPELVEAFPSGKERRQHGSQNHLPSPQKKKSR